MKPQRGRDSTHRRTALFFVLMVWGKACVLILTSKAWDEIFVCSATFTLQAMILLQGLLVSCFINPWLALGSLKSPQGFGTWTPWELWI
jgi:hypothetical protein